MRAWAIVYECIKQSGSYLDDKCMKTYNVTPGLEHHHSDRPSRKSIANNELRDDAEESQSERQIVKWLS